MLKIRMQGTPDDLDWFRDYLKRSDELRVLNVSRHFTNKGTSRYLRMYADVELPKRETVKK